MNIDTRVQRTKRAEAIEQFKKMLDAMEEHHSDAAREDGETFGTWSDFLGRVMSAMYAADIPTKDGVVTLKIDLVQR